MSELIERLRLAAEDAAGGPPSAEQVDALVELVDALEAELAARQPSEDDREATEAEIDKAARALHMAKCCSLSGDSPHDFPEASELFAAGVVLNAVPRAVVPDAATEAKQPEGWSTEDRQEAKREAERRWSRPVMREAEQRYQSGCINGFILGAEWQKARETFISYKALYDEAKARIAELEAERDAALETIERVAALHVESDWKCGNPRHTNPEIGCPECYTECETCDRTYPCATVAALDGAPEPEVKP